jgi:hypothetical protein
MLNRIFDHVLVWTLLITFALTGTSLAQSPGSQDVVMPPVIDAPPSHAEVP